ncbi:MAG TPA: hypothetical protein VGG50_06175 [Streptosporangiaceae bacterium]
MASTEIHGGQVVYELLGPADGQPTGASDVQFYGRSESDLRADTLAGPPWPEDAWEQAVLASARGTGNIFDPWVHAAPLILDFARQ